MNDRPARQPDADALDETRVAQPADATAFCTTVLPADEAAGTAFDAYGTAEISPVGGIDELARDAAVEAARAGGAQPGYDGGVPCARPEAYPEIGGPYGNAAPPAGATMQMPVRPAAGVPLNMRPSVASAPQQGYVAPGDNPANAGRDDKRAGRALSRAAIALVVAAVLLVAVSVAIELGSNALSGWAGNIKASIGSLFEGSDGTTGDTDGSSDESGAGILDRLSDALASWFGSATGSDAAGSGSESSGTTGGSDATAGDVAGSGATGSGTASSSDSASGTDGSSSASAGDPSTPASDAGTSTDGGATGGESPSYTDIPDTSGDSGTGPSTDTGGSGPDSPSGTDAGAGDTTTTAPDDSANAGAPADEAAGADSDTPTYGAPEESSSVTVTPPAGS